MPWIEVTDVVTRERVKVKTSDIKDYYDATDATVMFLGTYGAITYEVEETADEIFEKIISAEANDGALDA